MILTFKLDKTLKKIPIFLPLLLSLVLCARVAYSQESQSQTFQILFSNTMAAEHLPCG